MDFSIVPTLTLFAMMLALGLELQVADFLRIIREPRALVLGMAGQHVLLPLVAVGLIFLLPLSAPTAMGLLLIAACPGGATSNMLSRYAGGDVALSISLTAGSSLLAPLWVPLMLTAGSHLIHDAGGGVDLALPSMIGSLLLTTALPVLLGMAGLRLLPRLAGRCRGPLLASATAVLIVLIAGLAVNTGRVHGDPAAMFGRSLLAVAALLTVCAGVAAAAARLFALTVSQRRSLVLEVGVQNVNLALVVALTVLEQPSYLGPTLVYLPVMFVFALVVVLQARWGNRRA